MSGQSDPGGSPPHPRSASPHDALFRRVFGVAENAASQLRAVLPAKLLARMDLNRLTPEPAGFVDDDLRSRYSDLLFSAPLDDRDAYVYLLVEHQSSSDSLMAFRMLQYVTRIWDQYVRDHAPTGRLPAVIPLVVHHGDRPWSTPVQMLNLIDLDPDTKDAIKSYLPRFEFFLDELNGLDTDRLRDRHLTPSASITLLLLESASANPHVVTMLRPWSDELRALLDEPDGDETFRAMLTYIGNVSETPIRDLEDLAESLGPDAKEAYMTTAEMLRDEGRAEALVQALTARFGSLPESVTQTVNQASSEQLHTWTARAIAAKTLRQVFD